MDYNGVLNVDYAGGRYKEVITQASKNAIRYFLLQDQQHKVGICSYIGKYGQKSQERRNSLTGETATRLLNRWLQAEGIGESQLVGLLITDEIEKGALTSSRVSAHVDDKVAVLHCFRQRRVAPCLFSRYHNSNFSTVDELGEYFRGVQRLTFPREYYPFSQCHSLLS